YLLRSKEFTDLRVAKKEQLSKSRESFSREKIMFHPHCHQRAEGPSADGLPSGTNATLELLRSCGYEVELLDTGCCGIAGTFGYEAEHYELSMKVGELKLFPALAPPVLRTASRSPNSNVDTAMQKNTLYSNLGRAGEGLVASSGAACRIQIQQGTGVKAIHPIVLIANLVNEAANHDER
ncbi:MAG TPA: heterodisulfide reductase-related iron-sulfur binding cluster, partial [Anaerolineales bacterium]